MKKYTSLFTFHFSFFVFHFLFFAAPIFAQTIGKSDDGSFYILMPDGSYNDYDAKNKEHKKLMSDYEKKLKTDKEKSETSSAENDKNKKRNDKKAATIAEAYEAIDKEKVFGAAADNAIRGRVKAEYDWKKFIATNTDKSKTKEAERLENWYKEQKEVEKNALSAFKKAVKESDSARKTLYRNGESVLQLSHYQLFEAEKIEFKPTIKEEDIVIKEKKKQDNTKQNNENKTDKKFAEKQKEEEKKKADATKLAEAKKKEEKTKQEENNNEKQKKEEKRLAEKEIKEEKKKADATKLAEAKKKEEKTKKEEKNDEKEKEGDKKFAEKKKEAAEFAEMKKKKEKLEKENDEKNSSKKKDEKKKIDVAKTEEKNPEKKQIESIVEKKALKLKPEDNVILNPPFPTCEIAFNGLDEFTNIKRIETNKQDLFKHTDEIMLKYYEKNDFLTCQVSASRSDKGYKFLNFFFTFNSDNVQNTYGVLEKDQVITLRFLDGETMPMFNSKTDRGFVDPMKKTTTYKAIVVVNANQERKLFSGEIDQIRVLWGTGTDDYAIYDLDFFANILNCVK